MQGESGDDEVEAWWVIPRRDRGEVSRSGVVVIESSMIDGAALGTVPPVAITYEWRADFSNDEVNQLHAEAFETRVFDESEWNWRDLVSAQSLGWVVARDGTALVGFVNVPWDGLVHAWIQDTMVAANARGRGVGTRLVAAATAGAREAGCEWLHVDFDDHLRSFYLDACGFTSTNAGLIALSG